MQKVDFKTPSEAIFTKKLAKGNIPLFENQADLANVFINHKKSSFKGKNPIL